MYGNKEPFILSAEKPFEYYHPDTEIPWEMKLNEGYKVFFGVQSWRRAYDIDRSKIHAYV